MALQTYKGTFAAATSTGNQSVTGVGFQPKAIIFWGINRTTTGFNTGTNGEHYGVAVSSSQEWCVSNAIDNAAATMNTGRYLDTGNCIRVLSAGTPTTDAVAGFVSMDSDGFTINWSDAPASAWVIHFLALGGSSITDAAAGYVTVTTAGGTQAFSSLGIAPDFLFTAYNNWDPDATGTSAHLSMGAFDGTNAVVGTWRDRDAVTTSDVSSYEGTDQVIALLSTSTAGTWNFRVDAASLDADGFTLTVNTGPDVDSPFPYLLLEGGSYKVGVETQKTSNGTKATTGAGFMPSGILTFSANQAAMTSGTANTSANKLSVFASDGTNSGGIWRQSVDNNANSSISRYHIDSRSMTMASEPSTSNAYSTADVQFDSDGFTIDWTADATAREFAYILFGPGSVSATVTVTVGNVTTAGTTVTPLMGVPVAVGNATESGTTVTPATGVPVTVGNVAGAGTTVSTLLGVAVTAGGPTAAGESVVVALTVPVVVGDAAAAGTATTPTISVPVVVADIPVVGETVGSSTDTSVTVAVSVGDVAVAGTTVTPTFLLAAVVGDSASTGTSVIPTVSVQIVTGDSVSAGETVATLIDVPVTVGGPTAAGETVATLIDVPVTVGGPTAAGETVVPAVSVPVTVGDSAVAGTTVTFFLSTTIPVTVGNVSVAGETVTVSFNSPGTRGTVVYLASGAVRSAGGSVAGGVRGGVVI